MALSEVYVSFYARRSCPTGHGTVQLHNGQEILHELNIP